MIKSNNLLRNIFYVLLIFFLIVFSLLGIFLTFFLIVLFRQINKITHQFETANDKIDSFKESMNTVNKSIDLFKSIFFRSSKNNTNK